MVTAELTVAIPTLVGLVLVFVQVLGVLGVLVLSARCADAARAGARAAARGETPTAAAARSSSAVAGAQVLVSQQGTLVRVQVSKTPTLLPGMAWLLPGRLVSATATADAEPAAPTEGLATDQSTP